MDSFLCTPKQTGTTLWCTVLSPASLLVFLFLYTKPRQSYSLVYSSVSGLVPGILVSVHQTQAELLFGVQFRLWPRYWYSCFCTPNPGRASLWCTLPPLGCLPSIWFLYTKPGANCPSVYSSPPVCRKSSPIVCILLRFLHYNHPPDPSSPDVSVLYCGI